jgi:hypothetical protein
MLLYSVSKRAFMGTPPVWATYEERARFWRVKWARARAGAWIVVSDRARDRVRERKGEEYSRADEDQTS